MILTLMTVRTDKEPRLESVVSLMTTKVRIECRARAKIIREEDVVNQEI
jgi:hypothetical protein